MENNHIIKKQLFFISLLIFSSLALHSQVQVDSYGEPDLIMPSVISSHIRVRNNDSVYLAKISGDSIVEIIDRYSKVGWRKYKRIFNDGSYEIGRFRKSTIYNSPKDKIIFMEKIGLWKVFSKNHVFVKTIDYSNNRYKKIRIFPKIGIYYKNKEFKEDD